MPPIVSQVRIELTADLNQVRVSLCEGELAAEHERTKPNNNWVVWQGEPLSGEPQRPLGISFKLSIRDVANFRVCADVTEHFF